MKPLKPILSSRIYFPGLISITFLPLLCIGYFVGNEKLYELRVSYYNKELFNEQAKLSNKTSIDPNTFRHYKEIALSEDEKQNDFILRKLIEESKGLAANKDTINGYNIQFTDRTKYADVIKTLDMCERDSINYMLYNDNIYLFWAKLWTPPPNKPLLVDKMDEILVERQQSEVFFQELRVKLKKDLIFLKSFWPSLIPLVGMIYFWRKSKTAPII